MGLPWPRLAAGAALAWGLAGVAVAVSHSGASVAAAFGERDGPDGRLLLMLAVGWAMLAAGAALAWCGWRMWRRGTAIPHHQAALALAGFTLGWTLLLAHIAGPVGVGGSAATLALLVAGRPRRTGPG